MREDICGLVERVTERESTSMLSDHDAERDIAIEVVMLKSGENADGASA